MSKDLTVTTIQSNLIWHDIVANLNSFEAKINAINQSTDLIILPEMFSTGFTMAPEEVAEDMDGSTMKWMNRMADQKNAVIAGSLVIKENGNFYNRFVWMHPGGMFHTYDKRHLFAMAGEHDHYTAGEEKVIISFRGWKICPLICYDLRFPVWSRFKKEFDVLIYVANWPEKRSYDWMTLLRARAIENQCYVVAVNRVGSDANQLFYNGDSCVIDPAWRQTLYHCEKVEDTHTTTLSLDHLDKVRTSLPFLKDRDDFVLM